VVQDWQRAIPSVDGNQLDSAKLSSPFAFRAAD
jgi:hypothetical protein